MVLTLNIYTLASALIVTALLLCGCGIPTFIFLAPPIQDSIQSESLTFFHDTSNDNEAFKGYNLYYKLYNNPDQASGEENLCRSDKDTITAEPPTLGETRLLSRRYSKVVINDMLLEPQIAIENKGSAQTITITLGDPLDANDERFTRITNSLTGESFRIHRNVLGSSSTGDGNETRYKLLIHDPDEYLPEDNDIENIVDDIDDAFENNAFYVAFYAVAFGLNDQFRAIYSEPQFLGYLSFRDILASGNICNS